MSRIGKRPVVIPAKVAVTIDNLSVVVKGPKGELSRVSHLASRLPVRVKK
jgi:large subunit ribosomal protein L6